LHLSRLVEVPVTEADIDLPEVQQFHCGDERWEREVAEWLRARTGASSVLEDIHRFGTEVWLYRLPNGDVVGVGSLGSTVYTWPPKSKKKEMVSLIPMVGIQHQFKGEPRGVPREDRYASLILEDLIASAAQRPGFLAVMHRPGSLTSEWRWTSPTSSRLQQQVFRPSNPLPHPDRRIIGFP
jgi:hypothetical protein